MRGENILRFSTGSGYFVPVIPAQAGIQEFEERTGSRLAPGRRAGAHSNVQAMKQANTQSGKNLADAQQRAGGIQPVSIFIAALKFIPRALGAGNKFDVLRKSVSSTRHGGRRPPYRRISPTAAR
jgi:hypothetical protein